MTKLRTLMSAALALGPGCGGSELEDEPRVEVRSAALSPLEFGVDFGQCDEIAGIGFVPGANARAVVPASLTPAGDSSTGIIVVRVAHCLSVVVDGQAEGEGTVAQIGITLVPPDGTGDIDNFTFIYHTDSARLAARLKAMGVRARFTPRLDYELLLDPSGTTGALHVESTRPGERFEVNGTINVPTGPFVPFTANWWDDAHQPNRLVKMGTPIPAIAFGGAAMTLTTPAGSDLADLIGATSLTFPILDSYNVFPAAHMDVTFVP